MDSALMFAAYQAEQDKLRQQPEQENNLVDALGKAALAAGVATAGILGGRRFFAGRGAAPTSVRNTSATTDLSNINVNNLRRASGRPPVNVTETVVPSRTAPRPVPQTTVERLGDANEITRQARSERPQGIKFVDQLSEEPTINTTQIIVPKTTTKETSTGQSFGLDYLNSLLGRKPAVEEVTRQARNERSQGIPFLDLSDEVRTSVDPWSGKETILTPFGSPTIPPVRTTETTTRGTRLLSPAASDVADRLLNDPDLLKRVEAEELAKENLLSSNRSEQAKQAARRRQVLTATGDDIISTLRLEANTAEAAAQGDFTQQYLKTAGYKDVDTMVDQQVANVPRNTNQTLNAIDAAEDQQTGRVYQQLQRNEDLDLNQVEIMEDMARANRKAMMEGGEPTQMVGYEADASINQVASQLPDGLPVDQAEGLRQNPRNTAAVRFMEAERNKIARELAPLEGSQLLTPTRVENELAKRLSGSTASSYGPKYTARKQALELYAQTGDPQFLETIEKFGLKPVSFDPDSEEITSLVRSKNIVNMPGVGEVSTASLRKPVITASTARQADDFIKEARQNKTQYIEDFTSDIEGLKQEIYGERRQLAEQTGKALGLQLEQAKARGQGNTVRQLETQLGKLRDIYRNPELGQHREFGEGGIRHLNARLRRAQETNNQQIANLEKRYPTTLTNPSGEGSRLFGEVNEEGDFIPETMELRSERRMIDTAPKGGGGRNIAEYASGSRNITLDAIREVQRGGQRTKIRDYDIETGGAPQIFEDDRSGSGRVVNRYGISLAGEQDADVTLRPSQPVYSQNEVIEEAYRMAQKNADDQAPTRVPTYEEAIESLGRQPITQAGRQSINASEEIRRIQRSNPPAKAQALVSSFLQQLKGV
jgi:hypothetical protein